MIGSVAKNGIVRREKQSVSIPSRDVLHLAIGLSLILLKGQGKSGIAGLNSASRGWCYGTRLGCARSCRKNARRAQMARGSDNKHGQKNDS